MSKNPNEILNQLKAEGELPPAKNPTQERLRKKLSKNNAVKANKELAEKEAVLTINSYASNGPAALLAAKQNKKLQNSPELSLLALQNIINIDELKDLDTAENALKKFFNSIKNFTPLLKNEQIQDLHYSLVRNTEEIYLKFIKANVRKPIKAIKILIKCCEFYEEIYDNFFIMNGELFLQIFKLSFNIIAKYVSVSSTSDAKTSSPYGNIDDFLILEKKLSKFAPSFKEYLQGLSQQYGKQGPIPEHMKELMHLNSKGLIALDYYFYLEGVIGAIVNYVHNEMSLIKTDEISSASEKLNKLEKLLKYGLSILDIFPINHLIEFKKDFIAFNYSYYGNSAKIYGYLVVINLINIGSIIFSIINEFKYENLREILENNILLLFRKTLKNYEKFITSAKLHKRKFENIKEIDAEIFSKLLNKVESPEENIHVLLKTINNYLSQYSTTMFLSFILNKSLNPLNLIQKFVHLIVENVDYGSATLANNIIIANLKMLYFYIHIDEIDEAKTLYNQAIILYKIYSQRYPEDFKNFNLELINKFNILYDDITIPRISNYELRFEFDKERALADYQQLLNLALNCHNLKWTIIETVNGSAFYLEIIAQLDQLPPSVFIAEFATYLQHHLNPGSIAYTTNSIIILGYSIMPVTSAIKHIEQFKERIRICQAEIISSQSVTAFKSSFTEGLIEDNSTAQNTSTHKETARIRKQRRLEQTIESFWQKQQIQEEIAVIKADMRRQQKKLLQINSHDTNSQNKSILQESLLSNAVDKKTNKINSQFNIKKIEAEKVVKGYKNKFFDKTQENLPTVKRLTCTQDLLLKNIQLTMQQIKYLVTSNTDLEERIEYTNLQAYIRQIFLSLMLWEEYNYYVYLQGSNPTWAHYRHGIAHHQWDIALLRKIADALTTQLPNALSAEQLPAQCQTLEKQLATLIRREHLASIPLDLANYKKRIAQELSYLHIALSAFNSSQDDGIQQLKVIYQLWNNHLLTGKTLNQAEQLNIQKLVTVLETLVNLGECYAQLKKSPYSAMRYQLFPESSFLEFLANCKNIYRNELCHNILFTSSEPVNSYILSSCQIFEVELIEDCEIGLQLASKLLNKGELFTPTVLKDQSAISTDPAKIKEDMPNLQMSSLKKI